MKIEEFKALPNGAKVVWTGCRGPINGLFAKTSNSYSITWSDGKIASGELCDLTEEWVASIDVATAMAEIMVPIPAGWEATGEFRAPNPQVDCYLHQDGVTVVEAKPGNQPCLGPRVILKRIVPPSLPERLRDYVLALSSVIESIPIQVGNGLLRRVTLGEVHSDLSRMLKQFDDAESKV